MHHTSQQGYAAIMTTILTLAISLTIISAFTFFALQEANTNRAYVHSIDAHVIAESGIEDAMYRILTGKQIGASQLLGVGSGTTTITVTTSGNTRTIRSEGIENSFQNNMQAIIDINNQTVNFYYGIQVGDGGLIMNNNSQVNGNIYSNGSIIGDNGATITGDATVAGGIDTDPAAQWPVNDSDFSFANIPATRDTAQSFTASETGLLPKISVLIAKVGSPSDLAVHITGDNGGKPKNTALASATIKASSVGTSASWIDVAFTTQPFVTNTTKYWIVLDYGSSGVNHWIWRKDSSDSYPNNTGKNTDNWSSGGASWVNVGGDLAAKIWIGGTNTKIEDVTIGDATSGTGRANMFVNDTIHGSACPNSYCIVENPPREELPISDGVIQDWKDEAALGGTVAGDYNVSNDVTLGPKKITGNLNMTSNNKILTISGTLYVQGNIDISNGSSIRCSASYGLNSCVVMADGWIHLSNNGAFQGSGTAGSYLMLLSDLECKGTNPTAPNGKPCGHHNGAIDLHNNADGAIFYAGKGLIHLHNNVAAVELTAYKIELDNNAVVTYESGLASAQFSSGPSGGYVVRQWHEVP